jgi:EmrB/QacA subfamily drug resistance transporter
VSDAAAPAIPGASRADPSPVAPSRVLLVVSAAVFLASLDLFIVNIAFPDIARSFEGTTVSDLSWVLNGFAIVFAALLVPAGRIADRVGRRRMFIAGLAVFTLGSALCAVSWSVGALVGFRVVQAVGAAMVFPTSLALLVDAFPPEKRAAAIGAWAGVGGVAAALGPPIGGLLVELSWHWVFVVNVPVGVLALVGARRVLRESRDDQDPRWPDAVGTGLLIVGVGLAAWGLVGAPDHGWGTVRTIGALVAGLVLVWGAVLQSRRIADHRAPALDLELFRNRTFSAATSSALLFSISFGALLLGNVLFMTGPWGYSELRAGLAIAPGPLMAAAVAVPSGHLAARFGAGTVARIGNVLFALGAAWWLWQATLTPDYVGVILPGMVLTGVGVGMVLPSVSGAVASTLPPQRLATGSAVLSAGRQFGSVIGVVLWIAIFGTPTPDTMLDAYQRGWLLMVVAAVLAVVMTFWVGRGEHRAVSVAVGPGEQPDPTRPAVADRVPA